MSRCALCPGTYNCVPPSGPGDSDLDFIGEAPGFDENRSGIPFVGKTGKEVNEGYLPLAGLRRGEVDFDNAISCYPDTSGHKLDTGKDQHIKLLYECAEHHLY